MSDQRRFVWRSGRLASSPLIDGWAIDLDSRDPSIPNLPLETPAAPPAPAAGGFFSLALLGVGGIGAGGGTPAAAEAFLTMAPVAPAGWGRR